MSGPPSPTQIDKAGRLLRLWFEGRQPGRLDEEPLSSAVNTLVDYRASFTEPLARVEGALAPLVTGIAPTGDPPTGRFKRAGAIVRKLTRHPGMRLTQMEDIAGLRVKFPNGPPEVEALRHRMLGTWPEAKVIDYAANPKPTTGYRAVHLIVPDGDRIVEVQLRTARQNAWADAVESWGDRLGYALKDGDGPADLVEYFERAAYKLALEDQGKQADERFERDFEALRGKVRDYFK